MIVKVFNTCFFICLPPDTYHMFRLGDALPLSEILKCYIYTKLQLTRVQCAKYCLAHQQFQDANYISSCM